MINHNKTADIFALGVTWYEAAEGNWPFGGFELMNQFEISEAICKKEPIRGSIQTEKEFKLICRMIKKASNSRVGFEAIYELLDPIES